jgi:hypothetical protein
VRADTDFRPIETERLRLRRSMPEDAETISAYRSDPDVNRQQGWDRTDPAGVLADIVEMSGRLPGEPGGWVQFTVEERETGTIVGDVGFAVADGEPSVIKVGYTISPGFQGLGYATEAIQGARRLRLRHARGRDRPGARQRRERSVDPRRREGRDAPGRTRRVPRGRRGLARRSVRGPSLKPTDPQEPPASRGLNSSQVSSAWITPRT